MSRDNSFAGRSGRRWVVRCSAVFAAVLLAGFAVTGVTASTTRPYPLVPGSPFLSGSTKDSGTFGIAYRPNGKFVVVSNYYAGKVASLAIGKDKLTLIGQVATGADPQGVAFSPNGNFVAVVNYGAGTVSMLHVGTTGKLTKKGSVSLPAGETAAFNPAGTLLAVCDQSGNVTIFSVSTAGALTETGAVSTGEGISPDLAFSPSGAYLAVLNDDSGGTDPQATISVFSVGSGGTLTLVAAPTSTGPAYNGNSGSAPAGVAFSPSGALLAVSDAANNDVLRYSVGSGGTLTSLGTPAPTQTGPAGIAFNPAGTLLATADSGTHGDVSFFTVGSKGSLTSIPDEPADGSGGPQSLEFSPSGDLLGVTNVFPGAAGSVSEYNTTRASH
jgi:DNA-binding beta-propeller fold protein YncE